jgi:hypothetical protein
LSKLRLLGLAIALTATFGLAACGGDDQDGVEESTTASADLPRFCELSQELDEAGTEVFKPLEQDPKATPEDFAKAEADFVKQIEPQLDEIAATAPEEIHEEAQILVASVRARGGLEDQPPGEQEAQEAETTIQQFEKENCAGS